MDALAGATPPPPTANGRSGLILLELAMAGALLFGTRHHLQIYGAPFALMGGFLALSVWFVVQGVENCGCFGSAVPMSPVATFWKNLGLVLLNGMLLLGELRSTPQPELVS